MPQTDPLYRIAQLRRSIHAVMFDNGELMVANRSPLPALLDIAAKAISVVEHWDEYAIPEVDALRDNAPMEAEGKP